jgi:hypothetical protein
MAYVGTPLDTTNAFQSLAGKRFSGDASTTDFTLDSSPNSTLDIEVFVENVRQDPNSAYTVSGTTLAFTGAPPSGTNNIYVVHQAKSLGTIDVPSSFADSAKVFNESGNDVDFRVESSGNANMLFISGGNDVVGIGAEGDLGVGIHIKTADSGATAQASADELVIENNGDAGITIATEAASNGNINFSDTGSNVAGRIQYQHNSNYMMFATDANERMRIASSGNVSIGSTSSPQKLYVYGSHDTDNGLVKIHTSDTSANDDMIIFYDGNGTEGGSISLNASANTVAYNTSSDYRLKENETAITDGITRLKQLKPYRFNWKADKDGDKVDGFFAHEVSSIVPEAIFGTKDAMHPEILYTANDELPEGKKIGDVKEATRIKNQKIDQSKLVPLLTSALQEAITKIETLETKVKTLEDA